MNLTVLNGSPRGRGSGTRILLEAFCRGFSENSENICHLEYVKECVKDKEKCTRLLLESEACLLAFPLYTDIVPGIVKQFIEHCAQLKGKLKNCKMVFIIQSGFPEAAHSRPAAEYMRRVCGIWGAEYAGAMVRGGVEGLGKRPIKMDEKMLDVMTRQGKVFGAEGRLDESLQDEFAGRERLSLPRRLLLPVLGKIFINPMFWDRLLKENGAYDERFARPLE